MFNFAEKYYLFACGMCIRWYGRKHGGGQNVEMVGKSIAKSQSDIGSNEATVSL